MSKNFIAENIKSVSLDEATYLLQSAFVKCKACDGWPLVYANDEFYKMVGYTPSQLKEEKDNLLMSIVVPDDLEKMVSLFDKRRKESDSFNTTYTLINRKGNEVTVANKALLVKEADDNEYFYSTLMDISANNQAQNDLKEANIKLKTAINHADLYFWEYNIKTHEAYTYEKSQLAFGFDNVMPNYPECLIEKGVILPEYVSVFRDLHKKIDKGALNAECEIRFSPEYGGNWFKIKYSTVFDNNGHPTMAYASSENIDKYKDIEEQFSIAADGEGLFTWVFYVKDRRCVSNNRSSDFFNNKSEIFNAPESIIATGSVHSDDIREYVRLHDEVLSGKKKNVSVRVRLCLNKGDDWAWYRLTYTVIFDKEGKPFKAVGSATNINNLIEEENRYLLFKSFVNVTGKNTLATFRFNLTKNFCGDGYSDNKELLKMQADGTVDGFFKYAYGNFASEEDLKKYKKIFSRKKLIELYKNDVLSPTLEYRYYIEPNKLIWLRAGVEMMENPLTHDIEAVIYAIDIDKEKRSSAIIHKLIDTDYALISTIDVKTGRIFSVSYDKKAIPFPPKDGDLYNKLCPKNVKFLVDDEYYEECMRKTSLKSIISELKDKTDLYFMYPMHYAGRLRISKWHYTYVNETKQTIVFTLSNVTDAFLKEQEQRKKLEDALAAAREASDAKSSFLARMSHDMRTPMNGILGLTDITMDMQMPDGVRDNLKKIDSSGKYLLSLINDTLDMNKIESQKMELKLEPFRGKEFLNSFLGMIEPSITEKGLTLEADIDLPDNDDILLGDKVRLVQVFNNIVSNAIKYTPRGGKIQFSASGTRDETYHHDVFVVKDNGIGMDKEFLQRIYEPFEQENNDVNMNTVGTGLGMSIVRKLVTLMDGHIDIKSKKGNGTTVTLNLFFPITKRKIVDEDNDVKNTDISILNGKRILLCEDHPLNTEIAVMMLKKAGCVVDTAENGQIGCTKFADSHEKHYDAVLMDIRMPVMDGLEAAKTIRAMHRADAKTVPILAMTANAFDEDVEKSRQAGMDEHLAKPIVPAKLFVALAKHIAARIDK